MPQGGQAPCAVPPLAAVSGAQPGGTYLKVPRATLLLINLLSSETHVLSVRCRGALAQRCLAPTDFSYLSPEMNSVLNWNKLCS